MTFKPTANSISFQPPTRRLLGPGPSDVYPQVSAALARPTIGHLDPEFIKLMDQIKQLLQYAFQTENSLTMPISAPGSAGMEACFVNLIEPGDKVIVCQNGVFGGRMKENVERIGAHAIMVIDDWGKTVDLEKLEQTIEQHSDAIAVAFVHAETSTGVRADAAEIARLARQNNMLSIMDTVTGLGGIEVALDDWQIDAAYSGSQKCLSCTPGLSPVSFSTAAQKRIKARNNAVQSWFLDLNLVMDYWGSGQQRSYHHTAPVNSLYALHESLLILQNEGLQAAWQRHTQHHQALKSGLKALGLKLLVDQEYRLPQLNTVCVPDGIDEAKVRASLLNDFSMEIGAGLGQLSGKVWRIGLMGCSARASNVRLCIAALGSALAAQGYKQDTDAIEAVNLSYH